MTPKGEKGINVGMGSPWVEDLVRHHVQNRELPS